MDISPQFLTDFLLNFIGYLAAGALAVVVYLFVSRKKAAAPTTSTPVGKDHSENDHNAASAHQQRRKIEFVSFAEEPVSSPVADDVQDPQSGDDILRRRDRSDVIRVARAMLNAGASTEKIRNLLPVSEAELSLLSMSGD